MDIVGILREELKISEKQINSTIGLIDEGNTIPFIARYRKEVTGNLDDEILRNFEVRLNYLRNLSNRQEEVIRLIKDQDKLTEEIERAILRADNLQKIEDIYRPFKPKRRTRGMVAREKNLEGLAGIIYNQEDVDLIEEAKKYIDTEKEVLSVEDALNGAMDIIAEDISDEAKYREMIRRLALKDGIITTEKIKDEDANTYEMYYGYQEPISKILNHRVLAINRGEKEKVLRVSIVLPEEEILEKIKKNVIKEENVSIYLVKAIEDGYKRLIYPSIERELRSSLTEKAEEDAIDVFSLNLKPLLLQQPIKNSRVLAIDPGFRTGCKLAVLDENGSFLEYKTIFPTEPRNEVEKSQKIIKSLIEQYQINLIAIGNGTASRETEKVVADLLKTIDSKVSYTIVSEAGASIYSASQVAQDEFPELDVSIRGAISIGRRLQDPLPELVKIDPKHIGVGQYQHDLNQKKLDTELSKVVEDSVNKVGVDLNNASSILLEYVSGISKRVSKNIIDYRNEVGRISSRNELKKVKGLGAKTFTQCAGFLRIRDGKDILDNTGVHPESYDIARKILEDNLLNESLEMIRSKIDVGEHTLKDIVFELKKPGRDPREDMPKPIFRNDVLEMEDLKEGMSLVGTVRNVVDFGAFVDIGVKQDGLVHISNMADRYIKHPNEVVKVGDNVEVKILDVDMKRGRIGLTMKEI